MKLLDFSQVCQLSWAALVVVVPQRSLSAEQDGKLFQCRRSMTKVTCNWGQPGLFPSDNPYLVRYCEVSGHQAATPHPSIDQCPLASLVHLLPPFLPHWGDSFPGCSLHAAFHLSNLLVHLCRDTWGRCFLWDRNRAFKGQECWHAILGEFLTQPSELAVERRLRAASVFPKCKRGHTKPLKR